MTSRSDGQATRERILQAAARHVGLNGPAKLTIESAADAAGLSKGAVLYHFKTKNALIEAMLASVLDAFERATGSVVGNNANVNGSYASAYAQVSFDLRVDTLEAAAGMLAAVANDIDLLKPAAERHEDYQRRLEADGINPAVATLVRLAADGLYFARAFDLAPPSNGLTKQVLAILLDLVTSAQSRNS
jgi:AcrR family transcriptional regulator